MRDNHLHTYFSYDSDADFRDYLEHYDGEIVTTEHLDLSNPYPYDAGSPHDDIPDYESYSRKIAFLNKKYGNRIKKGIEIGYYRPRKKDTLAFLEYKDYDLKLLSVHHNGKFDYLEAPVLQLEKMQWIPDYLKELEEARIFTYQGALTNVQANYEQYHYVDGLYFDYLVDRGDLEVKEIILKILKDPKISKSDKEDIEVYLKYYKYYISDPDGYTNVREGKSTSSKIITTVDSGLPIRVLEPTGNWWQVMTKDNKIGYIHKSRIKKR